MNQTLKNIQRATPRDDERSFPALLAKFKDQVAAALPRHMHADRMARIALSAYRQQPKLAECDPRSVFASVIQAAQLGLEVGVLGEAHLVPFAGECQLVPGYTGLMKLARQSGLVRDIYAHEVRANDEFSVTYGLRRDLVHRPLSEAGGFPASDEKRGPIIGVYAVAQMADGTTTFVVMSIADVLKVRDASRGYQAAKRAKKETPWETDFPAMAAKTAIRRLCKFLPKSPELATALALSDLSDAGQRQNLTLESAVSGSYTPPAIEASSEAVDAPLPETPAAVLARLEAADSLAKLEQEYEALEPRLNGALLEALQRGYQACKARLQGSDAAQATAA
jgi:recombination protein RecT